MSCGEPEQHQIVCLDVLSQTPVDASSTSCTVTIRYSTSSIDWGFGDPQTMTAYGSISATWNYTFSTPGGVTTNRVIADAALTVPVTYGSAQTYGFGAVVSAQYLGGTPEHVIYWSPPVRPGAGPGVPGIGISDITQTSAYVWVSAPGSNGGSPIDYYEVHIDDDPNFGSLNISWAGGSGAATGLWPGSTWYARTRCHNQAGLWSEWNTTSFTTLSGGYTRVNGVWVAATAWTKVNGTWMPPVGLWKKVNGVWVK